MTMADYDRMVKPYLQLAQEYAYRCAREISRLPQRPAFFTLAQEELDHCEAEALKLLEAVRSAKRQYINLPVERDHAA